MAEPLITGSYYTIQFTNIWNARYWNDACRDWEEQNWRALVADMHELGMDTVINKQMAVWTMPLFPDPEMKVGKSIRLGCDDPAAIVADEASKRGMKVWYGLGMWGRDSEVADYRGLQRASRSARAIGARHHRLSGPGWTVSARRDHGGRLRAYPAGR